MPGTASWHCRAMSLPLRLRGPCLVEDEFPARAIDHLHPMPSRTDSSSSICQRCLRREEARGSHESSRRVSRIVGVHTTDNSATTYAQKIGRTALSRHATILRAENIGTGSTKCNNRKPRHDGSFASALRRVEDDFVLGVIVFSHCNTFVGGQLDGS